MKRLFLVFIFLYVGFIWPASGAGLVGFTEKARKCDILIHAGCPIASRPNLTSYGFALMANDVRDMLNEARSGFRPIIASTEHPRPGYRCDQPNFQEDVGAIMEIIMTAKGPCLRYYSKIQ